MAVVTVKSSAEDDFEVDERQEIFSSPRPTRPRQISRGKKQKYSKPPNDSNVDSDVSRQSIESSQGSKVARTRSVPVPTADHEEQDREVMPYRRFT